LLFLLLLRSLCRRLCRVAAHAAVAAVHATFGFVLCSNRNPDELFNVIDTPRKTLASTLILIDYFVFFVAPISDVASLLFLSQNFATPVDLVAFSKGVTSLKKPRCVQSMPERFPFTIPVVCCLSCVG